ncbi:uncharacterized protein LOC143446848 [Clavelina lepadiformis]|uniref:uncharacterized protein LOC143446848 n=1 Tax=Clavelina lepadiformis TaxID=159417 RepID=UPI0040418D30
MKELVMKFNSAKLTSICRNCIFVVLLSSLVLQGASDNVTTTAMSSATSKSTNSSVVTQSMVSTTRSTEGQTTTQVVVTSKPSTEATEPSTPEHAMATSTVQTTSKVLTAIMTTMSATSLSGTPL